MTSKQFGTVENESGNEISRTETGQRKAGKVFPKTHVKYWEQKVAERSYPKGMLQIRLIHATREGYFNLQTSDRKEAAKKAKAIYFFLKGNGWDATLEKFKPAAETEQCQATIGNYLLLVSQLGLLRPRTFFGYRNCLRTLVSEMFGIRGGGARFDYRTGGNAKWVEKINRIRLGRITLKGIRRWKRERIAQAGNSPIAEASTKHTINAYIRGARSLFAKRIREQVGNAIKLLSPIPLNEVELCKRDPTEYVSKINVQAIIAASKMELKLAQPEMYKIFLLALFAGLRRGEIDLLEWRMMDWQNSKIVLTETEFLHLKTKKSAATIDIDSEPMAELREFMATSKSKFVIDSTVRWKNGEKLKTRTRPPRPPGTRTYYRCDPIFDELIGWLRGKGVTANKPIHEMRKEIGAQIADKHGIYDASRFLRHSDIGTTARHYADKKSRISAGLGKFLETEIKPMPAANK